MRKKSGLFVAAGMCMVLLQACGSSAKVEESKDLQQESSVVETKEAETVNETEETKEVEAKEPTEINVFIAASLSNVMEEVAKTYNEEHPEVTINFNADSSGTLLTQIEEGAACDIFFSAAQKQMNVIEKDGLLIDGKRANVVNNQVVVVTRKDSDTEVTGLADLSKAKSIALADGSVPVGKYTRVALMNSQILEQCEDPSVYTTAEVSEALSGVEISEQSNVSKVLLTVYENACEVGTTYYSDTYGYEDELKILEYVSYDLTGDVIYPVGRIKNDEADEIENVAADSFYEFILSDTAKEIFEAYYFDTNVE